MSQIARFMRPTWGPPGAARTQVSPILAPWTLLSVEAWLRDYYNLYIVGYLCEGRWLFQCIGYD